MNGRIRTIKPEWLDDELLSACSGDARTLSVALMLLADDYGNGRAGEAYLAGRAFPGKIPETLRSALEELVAIRYVGLYTVEGQRYFALRNWAKHQRVDKPGKPRVSGPPKDLFAKAREAPAKVPGTPAPDLDLDLDLKEKNPPTPFPENSEGRPDRKPDSEKPTHVRRFEESWREQLPHQREDVQKVFAQFGQTFGRTEAKLLRGDSRGERIAEKLDAYGEEKCLLVVKHAPQDGKVNGSEDERKEKHETIDYVFGNNNAFERILHAGLEREGKAGLKKSARELLAEASRQ